VDYRCPVKKHQLQRGLLLGEAIEPILPDAGLKNICRFQAVFLNSAKIVERII